MRRAISNVTGVDLTGANQCNTTIPDGDVDNGGCPQAETASNEVQDGLVPDRDDRFWHARIEQITLQHLGL